MGNGSLSTLSSALEKLRMPAPSRPNTSLGFNHDLAAHSTDNSTAGQSKGKVQDDSNLGKKSASASSSTGTGAKPAGLGRSTTVGASAFANKGKGPIASGSKPGMKQATLAFPKAGAAAHKKPFMGIGRGRVQKATWNPGLATVIGSPVKGGAVPSSSAMGEATEEEEEGDSGFVGAAEEEPSPFLDTIVPVATGMGLDKGKGRAKEDFRRASAVSHQLSESIQMFRAENVAQANGKGKGLMGPPPVPANISARSTSSAGSPGGAGEAGTSSSPPGGGRRSTRVASAAATQALTEVFRKPGSEVEKAPVNDALAFLKECVIYVDVKTDDAEEAGALFVEMLEGVGAKVSLLKDFMGSAY